MPQISCDVRAGKITNVEFIVKCPPGCQDPRYHVYGTDVYASYSSVCGAAVHRWATLSYLRAGRQSVRGDRRAQGRLISKQNQTTLNEHSVFYLAALSQRMTQNLCMALALLENLSRKEN